MYNARRCKGNQAAAQGPQRRTPNKRENQTRPGALQTEAQTPASWHLPATRPRSVPARAGRPTEAVALNLASVRHDVHQLRASLRDCPQPGYSPHPGPSTPRPRYLAYKALLLDALLAILRFGGPVREYEAPQWTIAHLPEQKELPGAIATVDSSVRQRAARLHTPQESFPADYVPYLSQG